jgi:hypothetical protein
MLEEACESVACEGLQSEYLGLKEPTLLGG